MSLSVWLWGPLCLLVAAFCLWSWVDRWWVDTCPSGWRILRWPLTLGLSLGSVTLWMVIVGFWHLNAALALAFPVLTAVIGALTGPGRRRSARGALGPLPPALSTVRSFVSRISTGEVSAWVVLAALGAALAVVGHATYYPFIGDDELARYAYYARLVFTEGRITDAVRGYPMLMPLAYAYVFFTTGQLVEQLARVVPVLLSAATVVATGALATRWYGSRAGWAATFVLIASPLYLRWSPNGYIDIPSALFFVLCAYASDVWLEARRLRWAVLTGVCAGLALWTKQAGFLALVPVGVVWACAVARDIWRGDRVSALTGARDGALVLAVAILVGGWWYLRNVYHDGWGNMVPTPGILYYPQARRQLAYLVPFVGYADVFGRVRVRALPGGAHVGSRAARSGAALAAGMGRALYARVVAVVFLRRALSADGAALLRDPVWRRHDGTALVAASMGTLGRVRRRRLGRDRGRLPGGPRGHQALGRRTDGNICGAAQSPQGRMYPTVSSFATRLILRRRGS